MTRTRPLILGMCLGRTAGEALSPNNGAGQRLRCLLPSLTHEEYLAAFERRNLLPGSTWSNWQARAAARDLLPALRGRQIVVLGRQVWSAFRCQAVLDFFARVEWNGVSWHLLPHPSGRSLAYNDAEARASATRVLTELHERSKP